MGMKANFLVQPMQEPNKMQSEGGLMDASCKNVLDIGDIAELFKCSREKIKRMARSGELPAFKFGKCWYVLRNDLEHFLS
jgi:excisionase family DNA binding protein